MFAIKSSSKDAALILCVSGWVMTPVYCVVTTVGTLRTGKGSDWTVTRKRETRPN